MVLFDSAVLLFHYAMAPSFRGAVHAVQSRDSSLQKLAEARFADHSTFDFKVLIILVPHASPQLESRGPQRDTDAATYAQARSVVMKAVQETVRFSYWNRMRLYDEVRPHHFRALFLIFVFNSVIFRKPI